MGRDQLVAFSILVQLSFFFQSVYTINLNPLCKLITPIFHVLMIHCCYVVVSTYPSFFDGKAIAIDPTKDWPSLHFTFDGVDVSIPPSVYFLRMEQDGVAYYYLGIQMINDQVSFFNDYH